MRKLHRTLLPLLFLLLAGCATVPDEYADPKDPYESFNRASYSFNKALDTVILKPIAKGYDYVAPGPVKVGVSNFFSNLGELPTILNDVLQGKFSDAFSDTSRFLVNTTLGLAGFIDVATNLGLEQHDEDFGQTLGVWGVESGAYLMLPFLGPTTVRDVFGETINQYTSITGFIDHVPTRNTIYFTKAIDLRYRLLVIDSQLEDALDEYSFVKDAFLMRREYMVYDGDPPEEDDFYDDDCEVDDECDDDIID